MKNSNTLYAFYDLVASPISYDFVAFLVCSETARIENKLELVHVVIVPVEEGVGHQDNTQFSFDHAVWRLHNIVFPLCKMLPSCKGLTLCSSRDQAAELLDLYGEHRFPVGYTIDEPIVRHHTGWTVLPAHKGVVQFYLKATNEARSYARQWIEQHAHGRKVVAITLRESRFTNSRNSDPKVWSELARQLTAEGYFPVVLRDIDSALDSPPPPYQGLTMFPEGVFNLELRMGLYEESHICLFVANGPAQVCFYNKNVNFLYQVTGDWLEEVPSPFNRIGIDFGETPPLAHKFQRWIWQRQDADVLMTEFRKLSADIEASIKYGSYESCQEPIAENQLEISFLAKRFVDWASSNFFASPQEIELLEACYEDEPPRDFVGKGKLSHLAYKALVNGDRTAASEHLQALDDKFGLTVDQCVKLAVVCEAMDEIGRAVTLYERAIEEGENTPAVFFRLAIAYKKNQQTIEAIKLFELMIEKGAHSKLVTFELGCLYAESQPPEAVIQFYNTWRDKGIISLEIESHKLELSQQIQNDPSASG